MIQRDFYIIGIATDSPTQTFRSLISLTEPPKRDL